MPYRYSAADVDERLLEGCRLGVPLAQKYLYERYFGRLVGVAYRYIRDKQDAVEILNQAFLKIFQSLPNYQEKGALLGWMRTIVFRTTLNHIRSQVIFKEISEPEWKEASPSVENEALLNMNIEYILAALRQLPDASRAVFNLYEIDGFSHAEIAETLAVSVGTSKWRLSDAKARLRKILNQDCEASSAPLKN